MKLIILLLFSISFVAGIHEDLNNSPSSSRTLMRTIAKKGKKGKEGKKNKKDKTIKKNKKDKKNKKENRGKRKKRKKEPMKQMLGACISNFPEVNLVTVGKINIRFDGMGMYIQYDIEGLGANLTETRPGGIDMYEGTSCSDSSAIGDKHWNDFGNSTENPDPWIPDNDAFYVADEKGHTYGSFDFNNGYYWGENQGKIMVLHSSTGANIACGVLKSGRVRYTRSFSRRSRTVTVTCG